MIQHWLQKDRKQGGLRWLSLAIKARGNKLNSQQQHFEKVLM